MDELFRKWDLEEVEDIHPGEKFEYLPCQKKFVMKTDDEISIESIVSALLSRVHPSVDDYQTCNWDMDAKEMLNTKQCMLFEEKLFVSQLKDTNCKLTEERKIFHERELELMGNYSLNVEESYDGYVVYSESRMRKGKGKGKCGHTLRGKYDNRFLLICEKRMEYDYIDNARLEKTLEVRIKGDVLTAVRETKINDDSQKFRTAVNVQGRKEVLVLDGGVMLLMRHLVINHFTGEFEYYTMNLFGKIMRCKLVVSAERKQVNVFHRKFENTISVLNTQYFNNVAQEVSEAFYSRNGKLVIHYWFGYNYLVHATPFPQKPTERILPSLELMWKADHILAQHYERKRKLTYDSASRYLTEHPEACDFLNDFILSLLKYKPNNVLEFSMNFFHNCKGSAN